MFVWNLILWILFLPLQAAQQIVDWGDVAATAISSVGVLIALYLLRYAIPILKQKYEWMMPLIAMFGPMVLVKASEILLAVLGHPVDFGPLIEYLKAGGTAVAIHQVYKQATKKT